jgi:hypothetical protein
LLKVIEKQEKNQISRNKPKKKMESPQQQQHKNTFQKLWANDNFRMLFIAAGIMLCFFAFGIMQEKVMRGCFGGELVEGKCVDGEKYKYELTLVLVLCAWYALFARCEYCVFLMGFESSV